MDSDGVYIDKKTGMVVKNGHRYYDVGLKEDGPDPFDEGASYDMDGHVAGTNRDDAEFFSESFLRDRGIRLKSYRRRKGGNFGVLSRHLGHAIGDIDEDRKRERLENQWRLQHYVSDFSGGMPREAVREHYSAASSTQYSISGPRTATSVYLLAGKENRARARFGEEDSGGILQVAGANAPGQAQSYTKPKMNMPGFRGGGGTVGDSIRSAKGTYQNHHSTNNNPDAKANGNGGGRESSRLPRALHMLPLGYKMALMEQRFEALEYGVNKQAGALLMRIHLTHTRTQVQYAVAPHI